MKYNVRFEKEQLK